MGGQQHRLSPLIFYAFYTCVRTRPKIGTADLYAPIGGLYYRKKFFENHFSKMWWAHFRLRVIFILKDGFRGCQRYIQNNPVPRFGTGLHNVCGRLFASRILFTRCQPGRTWHLSYSYQSCASCLPWGFGCSGWDGTCVCTRPPSLQSPPCGSRCLCSWHSRGHQS